MSDARLCLCGHPRTAHEHFRPGTDCGACGAAACAKYRPQRGRPATYTRPSPVIG